MGVEMQIVMTEELQKILALVTQGKTYKEMSEEVGYSTITLKRRVRKLCNLYRVKNKLELALEYQAEMLGNI